MDLKLRSGTPEDAETCGHICFKAFGAIAREHTFPADVPASEVGVELVSRLLNHPGFYSVVAEVNGKVVGSNFLDERSTIAGVGPVTVDPASQDHGIGRALMHDVIARAADRGNPGIRLLQSAYHNRSLSLYANLGFQVRDLVACMQGTPPKGEIAGYRVRRATTADTGACATVCRRVHGHDRTGEMNDAIAQGTALVTEHDRRISGYATDLAFFSHAVGENNEDLKALIMAADVFAGPGILVPTTNSELFQWCLERDLRVVQLMTLMTVGLYTPPQGAYMPSVLY
ncbi:GNAT family N-acetyltransferase [Pseudonocardia aurantiaca]|uniref:GNAT family N-acetyltransferase n=1 Tax=Pseudonocardia aurantiaca TaxID=75290 RepID=A0ABW4FUL0_9PSEU